MTRGGIRVAGLLMLALSALACDDDDGIVNSDDPHADLAETITAAMPATLHGTARGMEYWYNQPDGYGAQINVPYDQLGCGGCHVYNEQLTGVANEQVCTTCHTNEATPGANGDMIKEPACLGCHGRQAAEIAMGLPDVHRAAGMGCADCHTGDEIHGPAAATAETMFGALETGCEGCHKEGGSAPVPGNTPAHSFHLQDVACQSCHMVASVTCYNCHFEEEVTNHRKVAYRKFADWLFLGRYRDKVYPLNFQSVEYKGETFNAWGPFHGHTITAEGRNCNACHGNANVKDLLADGSLAVTWWDPDFSAIQHRTGVIPVPPDYETSLRFDYVTKDGAAWKFVETGPDRTHMLFAEPLTLQQLYALRGGR